MRAISGLISMMLLVASTASGQSVVLQGSAGPTIVDSGYSLAGAIGFSPFSRLTVLFGAERTHLESRSTSDGSGRRSGFRGGTFTMGAAELQVSLRDRDRVSPYLLGGFGAGVSRPNINDLFPVAVTNNVRAFFVGGGIHVPLGQRLTVFGDVRMIVGDEAGELLALVPVRAGVSWRF